MYDILLEVTGTGVFQKWTSQLGACDHSASRSGSPFQLHFTCREAPIGPENQENFKNMFPTIFTKL